MDCQVLSIRINNNNAFYSHFGNVIKNLKTSNLRMNFLNFNDLVSCNKYDIVLIFYKKGKEWLSLRYEGIYII